MDNNSQTDTLSSNKKNQMKPINKRGTFPRISLSKVLELPITIHKIGEGEPVRRLIVFDRLGKSPESGPSRMLVTTSSVYGLTKGSYQADYLELTDIGKFLVTQPSSSKKYLEIIYKILFENKLLSEFLDYWKNKSLPSDEVASDWLGRVYKLSDADAKACWEIIKANILDWKLTETLSGRIMIITKEAALESIKDELYIAHALEEPLEQAGSMETSSEVIRVEEKRPNLMSPKPFGTQILERDFTNGRARLILPAEMTTEEINQLKLLINGLVKEIKE